MGTLYEIIDNLRKFCIQIREECEEIAEDYRDKKERFIIKWNALCDKAEEHKVYKRLGLFGVTLLGVIASFGVSAIIFALILTHPILMLIYVYISICSLAVLLWNNNKYGE